VFPITTSYGYLVTCFPASHRWLRWVICEVCPPSMTCRLRWLAPTGNFRGGIVCFVNWASWTLGRASSLLWHWQQLFASCDTGTRARALLLTKEKARVWGSCDRPRGLQAVFTASCRIWLPIKLPCLGNDCFETIVDEVNFLQEMLRFLCVAMETTLVISFSSRAVLLPSLVS